MQVGQALINIKDWIKLRIAIKIAIFSNANYDADKNSLPPFNIQIYSNCLQSFLKHSTDDLIIMFYFRGGGVDTNYEYHSKQFFYNVIYLFFLIQHFA